MTRILSSFPQLRKVISDKRAYFAFFGAIGGAISALLFRILYGLITVDTNSEGGALSTWVVGGGLNGMSIAALLTFGQSLYVGRSPDKSDIKRALIFAGVGGAVGGLAAWRIGFPLAAALGGATDAGRFIGWAILGVVVGFVVSRVVPNLQILPASVAGAIGGFSGCALMYILSSFVVGVATTGAAIGAAIALAETVFREAWLEVIYGPGEMRTVSLGQEPISIGSGGSCAVYAANTPAIACRFLLDNGVIVFEDFAAGGGRRQMQAGETVTVGRLNLRVQGAGAAGVRVPVVPSGASPVRPVPAIATPTGTFRLRILGRTLPLAAGTRLNATDIPGLEPQGAGQPVAEVVPNPNDPKLFGLKNLSRRQWSVTLLDGRVRDIEPGRTFRLEAGVKVRFGSTRGEIQL